jgi:CP family cyanate transporter-like MFS transporter
VVAGLLLLTAGIGLRLAGVGGLFAGTVLLSGGIALANVLLPAVARAEYGPRATAVVGLITASMAISAALGAGLAQPLADATGSALGGLALWAAPVLLAGAVMWLLAGARRTGAVASPSR